MTSRPKISCSKTMPWMMSSTMPSMRPAIAGALVGLATILVVAAPVGAQEPDDEARPERGEQDERCRVDPGGNDGRDRTLTDKLDACDGVLEPPADGDPEMVEPAPEEGRTPVIPPGALPGGPSVPEAE